MMILLFMYLISLLPFNCLVFSFFFVLLDTLPDLNLSEVNLKISIKSVTFAVSCRSQRCPPAICLFAVCMCACVLMLMVWLVFVRTVHPLGLAALARCIDYLHSPSPSSHGTAPCP